MAFGEVASLGLTGSRWLERFREASCARRSHLARSLQGLHGGSRVIRRLPAGWIISSTEPETTVWATTR